MRRLAALLLLLATPALAQEAPAMHGGPVRALATAPGLLASAGFDSAVILWDPAAGTARRVLRWHAGGVNALAMLADGRLASAGADGRIALWHPEDPGPDPAQVLGGHTAPVAGLAAAPDGRLASAGWDGAVRIWGPDAVFTAHQGPVNAVAFRDDGVLASAGFDGTVRLWPGGEILAELGLPRTALVAVPGARLAVAGVDGAVQLIGPGGAEQMLAGAGRPVVSLAVAQGVLAAASLGGDVALYDLGAGRLLRVLEGPGLPVWSVAFSPDGATLWTGGADRRVRAWDVATGRHLSPLGAEPAALPEGLDPEGARVFRACSACHSLQPGPGNLAGPSLHGIFGRRMGSLPGYRYSARLAQGDIIWTPETVADLFTRGPDEVTPGTTMPMQRVDNPEDRAALLRFLQEATR
ncbi:WD-40 repeat-containing protein [Humitalea rosea]|uniref:WD-40 repeat-containing protein n=1 Tax=Humitalea rosea TaxID=990373 RepID=A0A2W7I5B5_9PROT|nr:c-type cytochrome [Humitalea rosea]PZW41874.1 WD-40 repeat-containing protein [Humitalea rosea]